MSSLRVPSLRRASLRTEYQPFSSRQCNLFPRPGLRVQQRTSRTKATIAPSTSVEIPARVLNEEAHVGSNVNATSTATAASPESGTFPWTSHWYPVASVDDLDPSRPHATHLFGIPMALWRDAQGAWHAVEDKCPHRLAPLSEGRVEADGTLQCSYHGWQFNGQGACTHIPQLRGDDKAQAVACSSRRSCVRAFPTQVVHGLLWVLPDSSPQAHEKFAKDAALPGIALKELLDGPESEGILQTTQWFARDMPIRYDTLMENLVDPSHLPFSHHGVLGRRENEKGTTTKVNAVRKDGFEFQLDMNRPNAPSIVPFFTAPGFVRYGSPIRTLNMYAVPTRPGWSRLYATYTKDTRQRSPLPWIAETIFGLTEKITWFEHVFQRHPILDGDTYMVHVQERFLEERSGDWKNSFYMPAPADASVIALRKWFDMYGGAVPTCEPDAVMPPALTKREVLDRYSQHTQHCRHCKKALANIELATVVAAACAVLAAAWLAARAFVGLPLVSPAAGAGLAVLVASGAVAAWLRKLREQFFFVDYVHAEKK